MKIDRNGIDAIPVEVMSRHLACENTKFFVYFEHVVDSSGNEVHDYLVVSPKNAGENLVTGVAVLPVTDGRVGLIRIYRPAICSYSWEIPHGFVDEGESDYSSALRELLEETGLTVQPTCFSSLGYVTPDAGVLAARVHLFLAEASRLTHKVKSELGLRKFHFFSFDALERMIEQSEIQDTFTISAWCKYKLQHNVKNT